MNLQDFLNLCGKFSSKREEALKKNIGILLTYSKLFLTMQVNVESYLINVWHAILNSES